MSQIQVYILGNYIKDQIIHLKRLFYFSFNINLYQISVLQSIIWYYIYSPIVFFYFIYQTNQIKGDELWLW